MSGIIRAMPPFVDLATFKTFVVVHNITQELFPLKVMLNIGFLTLMTRESNDLPNFIQYTTTIVININLIRDFLYLPEIKRRELEEQTEEDFSVSITNGTFKCRKSL